jgi:hypothetical protein
MYNIYRPLSQSVRVRVTLQLTVSQSVCLGVEPNLGLLTRDIFFFESVRKLRARWMARLDV